MVFEKMLLKETIAAILGTALVVILVDVAHVNVYWLIILVPIIVVLLNVSTLKHKFQVFDSGMVAYYKTLSVREGVRYWYDANNTFTYLGVTGGTIQQELKDFLSSEGRKS